MLRSWEPLLYLWHWTEKEELRRGEKRSKGQPEQGKKSKAEEKTKRKLTECPPGAAGDATGTRRSPCFKPPAKLRSEQVRSLPKRTLRSSAGQGTGSQPHGDCGPQLALQALAYMDGAASPGVAPGSSPPLLAVSARALVGDCCTIWEPSFGSV